jgi:bisphosphoglycerate-dependent phosphoglycerate mutase
MKIDAAYASPLSGAKETAEIVTGSHGIPPAIYNGFIDMDYGEWTGKEDPEVAKLWPLEHTAWITNPYTVDPPEVRLCMRFSRGRLLLWRGLQQGMTVRQLQFFRTGLSIHCYSSEFFPWYWNVSLLSFRGIAASMKLKGFEAGI